jgi:hypothetical protein
MVAFGLRRRENREVGCEINYQLPVRIPIKAWDESCAQATITMLMERPMLGFSFLGSAPEPCRRGGGSAGWPRILASHVVVGSLDFALPHCYRPNGVHHIKKADEGGPSTPSPFATCTDWSERESAARKDGTTAEFAWSLPAREQVGRELWPDFTGSTATYVQIVSAGYV